MNRLVRLAALAGLLCFPAGIEAQYQVIELADVQLTKSVGATVQDPTGAPVPKAVVREFGADWKTVLRSSSTDTQGKFSFTPTPGRTIYFFQISAPGFDPLRFRLKVDTKRGASLELKLTVAT
ncbi:MAG TPA: carboxypeptidase-like regulatory domain-containing protein [Candidatus Acidoferrales bacterium]|nr:carboxypeptidase-like regulatory domain-containing protein [Candidatus Acidoferrales bacterium]